jgi:hypothetical protein
VGKTTQMLDVMAPPLLLGLQKFLQTTGERADQERYPHQQGVQLWSMAADGRATGMVPGQGRDVGRSGLTLFTSVPVKHGPVVVQMTRGGSIQNFRVPGRIVATEPVGDGSFEVEVQFEDL